MFLDGCKGKCNWLLIEAPKGWPRSIPFKDPNKIKRDDLVKVIKSMIEGKSNITIICPCLILCIITCFLFPVEQSKTISKIKKEESI